MRLLVLTLTLSVSLSGCTTWGCVTTGDGHGALTVDVPSSV